MNIDDPQKALAAQLDAEQREESPFTGIVSGLARVLEAVPVEILPQEFRTPLLTGKWFANVAASFLGKARAERREAFIDVLATELQYVKEKLAEVTKEHVDFMREHFPGLVVDSLEKAEQTRSRERIERIARIVANAAERGGEKPPDLSEELTRIAMSLDDEDVRVLTELVRGQRNAFNPILGSVPGESVNNYWRSGETASLETPGSPREQQAGRLSGVALRLDIPEGDLQARCAKLQAFGLTVQVERNQMKTPLGTLPYAVLARGIEFINAIRSLNRAK